MSWIYRQLVRPVLGSGGSGIEEYDTTDLAGNTVHLREEPRYSFFSTALFFFFLGIEVIHVARILRRASPRQLPGSGGVRPVCAEMSCP